MNHKYLDLIVYLTWIVVPWETGDTRTMVTPKDSICQDMSKEIGHMATCWSGDLITRDNSTFGPCILSSVSSVDKRHKKHREGNNFIRFITGTGIRNYVAETNKQPCHELL